MQKLLFWISLIIFELFFPSAHAEEYLYILNEDGLNKLYNLAIHTLAPSDIYIEKIPLGILIGFYFDTREISLSPNYKQSLTRYFLSPRVHNNLLKIEYFLAKIKNPVIIEVHTDKDLEKNIKNWELSTVFANKIESVIIKNLNKVDNKRIKSVGYGEFLPAKNTSNNGGNYRNRIDIIILYDISGE